MSLVESNLKPIPGPDLKSPIQKLSKLRSTIQRGSTKIGGVIGQIFKEHTWLPPGISHKIKSISSRNDDFDVEGAVSNQNPGFQAVYASAASQAGAIIEGQSYFGHTIAETLKEPLTGTLETLPSTFSPSKTLERAKTFFKSASDHLGKTVTGGRASVIFAKVLDSGEGQRNLLLGNVGDGRAYLSRRGSFNTLTPDRRPSGSTTEFLGGENPSIETWVTPVQVGDKVILTNKGVSLPLAALERMIARNPRNLARQIITAAREDQIHYLQEKPKDMSAVVIEIKDKEQKPPLNLVAAIGRGKERIAAQLGYRASKTKPILKELLDFKKVAADAKAASIVVGGASILGKIVLSAAPRYILSSAGIAGLATSAVIGAGTGMWKETSNLMKEMDTTRWAAVKTADKRKLALALARGAAIGGVSGVLTYSAVGWALDIASPYLSDAALAVKHFVLDHKPDISLTVRDLPSSVKPTALPASNLRVDNNPFVPTSVQSNKPSENPYYVAIKEIVEQAHASRTSVDPLLLQVNGNPVVIPHLSGPAISLTQMPEINATAIIDPLIVDSSNPSLVHHPVTEVIKVAEVVKIDPSASTIPEIVQPPSSVQELAQTSSRTPSIVLVPGSNPVRVVEGQFLQYLPDGKITAETVSKGVLLVLKQNNISDPTKIPAGTVLDLSDLNKYIDQIVSTS